MVLPRSFVTAKCLIPPDLSWSDQMDRFCAGIVKANGYGIPKSWQDYSFMNFLGFGRFARSA